MAVVGGKFEVLTSQQIEQIHQATLQVLEKTGIRVKSDVALHLLEEAGADVDHNTQRARIHDYLIEEGVRRAPKSIRLCGRDPENDLTVEGNRSYFGLGGSGIYMLDAETRRRRAAIKRDLEDSCLLADALGNIDFLMGLIIPQDVDQAVWDRHSADAKLRSTTKHSFTGALGADGARDVLRMAALVAGGEEELRRRPLFSFILCPVSPLTHDARNTETAIELAKHGAPIIWACEAISGATAPVTLAGTLVQQNAEVLSGVLIAQLVNPGTPVFYGAVSSPMDMRNGNIALGVPEVALLGVAASQLAHHYGIPMYSTGGITDSKVPDAQSAYEKALQQVLLGLAGGNLIHNAAGMLDKMITGSLEQMVIDDEVIGMVKRIIKGIDVSPETLALDVIDRVGPSGNFLAQRHSREFYLREHRLPGLSDTNTREMWERLGSKDAVARAGEKVKEILGSHSVKPLDDGIKLELGRMVKEAEKRLSAQRTH